MILPFPLNKIQNVCRRRAKAAAGEPDDYTPLTLEETYPDEVAGATPEGHVDEARRQRRRLRLANQNKAMEELFRGGFDSCVLLPVLFRPVRL